MSEQLERRVRWLERRLEKLMADLEGGIRWSTANVSATPTNAELDTEFGTASTLYNGFAAVVDDAGAGATYWLCICDADNDTWVVEQLTIA